MDSIVIVTGDDLAVVRQLKLKSEATGYQPFDMQGLTAKARIVSLDHLWVFCDEVTLDENATNADWANSLVEIEIPGANTSGIVYQGDALVEVQVEFPEKTTWFFPAHIVKGNIS